MDDMDAVVFAAGDYEYRGEHGTAIVHVPHDVTLGDVAPALSQIAAEARTKEEGGEDAA